MAKRFANTLLALTLGCGANSGSSGAVDPTSLDEEPSSSSDSWTPPLKPNSSTPEGKRQQETCWQQCRAEAEAKVLEPDTLVAEIQPDGSTKFPAWERAMAECRRRCGFPAEPGDKRFDEPLRKRNRPNADF